MNTRRNAKFLAEHACAAVGAMLPGPWSLTPGPLFFAFALTLAPLPALAATDYPKLKPGLWKWSSRSTGRGRRARRRHTGR
jgi:hypothetical protein